MTGGDDDYGDTFKEAKLETTATFHSKTAFAGGSRWRRGGIAVDIAKLPDLLR